MSIPKLFRVTVEVGDLESATELYRDLFGGDGERHRGARHYFDCGGTIVALLADGGWKYLSEDLWTRDVDELEEDLEAKVLW